MAELGVAASVIGVVGFVGQITEGCVYLIDFIGDIKDAPKNVRSLQNELDLITSNADHLRKIHEEIGRTEPTPTISDPSDALKLCYEAVAELTKRLKVDVFDDAGRGRRSWQRLKYALKKEKTKEMVDGVGRARLGLQEVREQTLLELANHQTKRDRNLAQSIFKLQEDCRIGNHALSNVERATDTSVSINNVTQRKTETVLSEVSSIKPALEQLSADIAGSGADFRRLEDGVQQLSSEMVGSVGGIRRLENGIQSLPDLVARSTTSIKDSNNSITSNILEQINIGFSRQAETRTQADSLLLANIAHLVEAALGKDRQKDHERPGLSRVEPITNHANSMNPEPSTTIQRPEQSPASYGLTRRKGYKCVSWTWYKSFLCDISIKTLESTGSTPEEDSKTTNSTSPIRIKRLEIRTKLGIFKRSFTFTQTCRKYYLGSELLLRTRNIVRSDHPAIKAAKAWDLDTMRSLLESRQASPFDVAASGGNYLDLSLEKLNLELKGNKLIPDDDFMKLKALVSYFLDLGIGWESPSSMAYSWSDIFYIHFRHSKQRSIQLQKQLQDVLRTILAHTAYQEDAEISGWWIDREIANGPVFKFLLNQGFWIANTLTNDRGKIVSFYDNDRSMSLDPFGHDLKHHLQKEKRLEYWLFSRHFSPYSAVQSRQFPLFALLRLVAENCPPDLRENCFNRLVIFLIHGEDVRKAYNSGEWHLPRKMTATEYAAWCNESELWEEALRSAGWTIFEIMHLSDEDIYRGVPELVNGEIWYLSHIERWEKTKTALYEGNSDPDDEEHFSVYDPNAYGSKDVFRQSRQIFIQREHKIPGDWPSEEWAIDPNDKARLDALITKVEERMDFLWLEDEDEGSEGGDFGVDNGTRKRLRRVRKEIPIY